MKDERMPATVIPASVDSMLIKPWYLDQ